MNKEILDGNTACALVSYMFTEACSIYPITPSSTMAELIDEYSSKGKLNFYGNKVKVVEMQSEAGAIGTMHGMLLNGVFSSTYTASQGLLLMIPNMYKIAGELLPSVINVAARTVATHALSIMGDHSDIYACRATGFAFLASSSVQDAHYLTSVAYLSTIKGRIPFINFFDGFRTSHEYNKINLLDLDKVKGLLDMTSLNNFRKRTLDIDNPTTHGTNQGDQIYFQSVEARNKYYLEMPDIVNHYMQEINSVAGTNYAPFNYYGKKDAENVIVAMGSVCDTIKEYIDLTDKKIGLIEVHLYRPFSSKYFLNVLPKTTKKIAVLDRTKEPGSNGEPLYLDVCEVLKNNSLDISVTGGRYGLSSKDTNLNDIEAVYNFLEKDNLHEFTIGIVDDVTFLSLERTKTIFKKDYEELLIYGYGSDGMVTTSKDILKLVGKTDKYVQGYFEYDSKKSGGVTKCHLRIGDKLIKSTYYVTNPKVVVCSKDTYLNKYDILSGIKEDGIFILNTEHSIDELVLPSNIIETLKNKNINFYIVNANKIARDNNIPNKISMIMEAVILNLTSYIDKDESYELIKNNIIKNFTKKGEDVVNSNINALKDSISTLVKVDINKLRTKEEELNKITDNKIFSYLESARGNELKVSDFLGYEDGTYEGGLSKLEKRKISSVTPCYDKSKCISCNLCSLVCPHSVIRPYLLNKEEVENAPLEVKEDLIDAKIKDKDLMFTIGVSTLDCTGCSLCTNVCPTKAITMENIDKTIKKEQIKIEYLDKLEEKKVLDIATVKGSQFVKPTFAFSGACAGCGETPYLKLLSSLFKDNLVIANATGCSSIYAASLPNTSYSVPWANSLFEDNAEFGYGIRLSENLMKENIKNIMKNKINSVNSNNQKLFDMYLNSYSKETSNYVYENLDYNDIKELEPLRKYIKEKSIWIVGGDGWAYDIGYGGIDHVLANKENVNILVLDTECYSNTGGQASKSSRPGAILKFASDGKKTSKKNLAKIAMSYPHVYVGTISLGANYNGTIKTLIEAENYDGPSIVIAYAPCIAHGIKEGMKDSIKEEKLVVEKGYFPLFRYNPTTKEFKLDSKADFTTYEEIFKRENRYRIDSDLLDKNKEDSIKEYEYLNEKLDK